MTLAALANQLHMSPELLCQRADEHTLAVQAWLASRAPQAETHSGQGVRVSSTGIAVPLLNLALGAAYPARTDEGMIRSEIEAVKAFFAARGVSRWYWWLGVTADPRVPGLLEQHGLVYDRPPLPAMVAALNSAVPTPPVPPGVRVWLAQSPQDLQHASHIRRTAFRFPDGVALDYFEALPQSWLHTEGVWLYLAALEGHPPAAIGALIVKDGLPGVYVMATLPEHGRRGLGKAVLAQIMQQAAAAGHELIVLTASRVGFQLYSQFGFVRVFDYAIYRPDDTAQQ